MATADRTLALSTASLRKYLSTLYEGKVKVLGMRKLGTENTGSVDIKMFGYGFPYVIEIAVDGKPKKIVLETLKPEGFGHDHFSDRAQILLWQHSAFNNLPRHVRSIDVGAFALAGDQLRSLGKCHELFILTEFVEGTLYHSDLDSIKGTGQLTHLDEKRCLALSGYLAEIHNVKREAPWLYTRRARDLVGHGECIMGLLDSYPAKLDFVDESYLVDIERDCIVWRWLLKHKGHRLSQVHGDFHPWNILFRKGADFTLLDRSRGEWGEPADDVAAMTINYLFYSLQQHGELSGAFGHLFKLFWDDYLEKTGDHEILDVIQPFYAWRGLVVASPIWYPSLTEDTRIKLMNFVKNVLQQERFDPNHASRYFARFRPENAKG